MNMKDRLQADWITAMKEKNKPLSSVLNMAKAAILQVEKTDNRKVEDEEALQILSKEVKLRRESLEEFEKAGRSELADEVRFEIDALLRYLPSQLSEEEIRQLVEEQANALGANNIKDMGKLMAALKPLTAGRVDNKVMGELVKKHLMKK